MQLSLATPWIQDVLIVHRTFRGSSEHLMNVQFTSCVQSVFSNAVWMATYTNSYLHKTVTINIWNIQINPLPSIRLINCYEIIYETSTFDANLKARTPKKRLYLNFCEKGTLKAKTWHMQSTVDHLPPVQKYIALYTFNANFFSQRRRWNLHLTGYCVINAELKMRVFYDWDYLFLKSNIN